MSAVNTQLHNNGYYQLNSSGAGAGNAGNAGRTNYAGSGLAGALNDSAKNGFSDAVLLDLSPAAQKYLSSLNAKNAQTTDSSLSNASRDGFVLSAKQKLAVAAVLERYKDSPYTQETFDAIQDDLQKEGLGPNQLSLHERVNSFNPTASLLDALNGGNGTTPGSTVISDEELSKKATNYIQDIAAQWKKLSVDANKQNADAVAPIGAVDNAG